MDERVQVASLVAVPSVVEQRGPGVLTRMFLTATETAEIVRLDESTLYRHMRNGRFPAVKIGGRYVVPRVVLERLVEDVLATGTCVDLGEWTQRRRAEQEARVAEQARSFGVIGAVGGGPR